MGETRETERGKADGIENRIITRRGMFVFPSRKAVCSVALDPVKMLSVGSIETGRASNDGGAKRNSSIHRPERECGERLK